MVAQSRVPVFRADHFSPCRFAVPDQSKEKHSAPRELFSNPQCGEALPAFVHNRFIEPLAGFRHAVDPKGARTLVNHVRDGCIQPAWVHIRCSRKGSSLLGAVFFENCDRGNSLAPLGKGRPLSGMLLLQAWLLRAHSVQACSNLRPAYA
jgi:hypothetical protein